MGARNTPASTLYHPLFIYNPYNICLTSVDYIFPQILDRCYTDILFQICLTSVDYIFSADLRQILYRYSVSNLFDICGLFFFYSS